MTDDDRAARFALWIRTDQQAQRLERMPEVQLELEIATPTPRMHPGDPDGLEHIGPILRRWLAELYAKQMDAA